MIDKIKHYFGEFKKLIDDTKSTADLNKTIGGVGPNAQAAELQPAAFLALFYCIEQNRKPSTLKYIRGIASPFKSPIDALAILWREGEKEKIKKFFLDGHAEYFKIVLKNGDMIKDFLSDSQLKQYLLDTPDAISDYISGSEMNKVREELLSSDSEALIWKALNGLRYNAVTNGQEYGFGKSTWEKYYAAIRKIKNKEIMKKILIDNFYSEPALRVDDIFRIKLIQNIEEDGFSLEDVLKAVKFIRSSSLGNDAIPKLLLVLDTKFGDDAVEKFTKAAEKINIQGMYLQAFSLRPFVSGEKRFGPELELDFFWKFGKALDIRNILAVIDKGDEEFIAKAISSFPSYLDEILNNLPAEKIPNNIKDVFMF